jgi:acid phosphatase
MTSFPSNYELLPTVSFVIPNQVNDMHDGTDPERIYKADAWLKDNLDGYVQWAQSHNSLLVITFDEGQVKKGQVKKGGLINLIISFFQDGFNRIISFFQDENEGGSRASKHIFTAFVGEMVKPGSYEQKIDHYSVLRTVEEMYGLSYSGSSAASLAIRNVWK